MLPLTEANIMRVYEIYRANSTITAIDLELVMDMLDMIDTTAVDRDTIGNTPGYWTFLMAVLKNIETGKWNTYPNLWYDYYYASKSTDLIGAQIDKNIVAYAAARKAMCERLNIQDGYLRDKHLILHWVRNRTGERDILETLFVIVKMYLDFTNSTMTGKTRELGTVLVSFNTANKAKPPVIGKNKQEVMKNNLESKVARYT